LALKTTSGAAIEGRIPNDALRNGHIEWSRVPAYIPFYSGRRLIGYVEKTDVEHRQAPIVVGPLLRPIVHPGRPLLCRIGENGVNVYNKAHVLIGQIFPATGFLSEKALHNCGNAIKIFPLPAPGRP
jgi:hypothetical protein